jgi:hypothetical protein
MYEAFARGSTAADVGNVHPALTDPVYGHRATASLAAHPPGGGGASWRGSWVYFGKWTAETLAACEVAAAKNAARLGAPAGTLGDGEEEGPMDVETRVDA